MLKRKDDKITVIAYGADSQRQIPLISTSFECRLCKHVVGCRDVSKCKFAQYITDKIATAQYSYKVGRPTVYFDIASNDEYVRAMHVISRAKRLRAFKQLREYVK